MRQLFLLLLLLNVAFFAWQFQKESHKTVDMEKKSLSDKTIKRLVLVSELNNKHDDETLPGGGTDTDETRHSQQEAEQKEEQRFACYTVGPFADKDSAHKVSLMLDESGLVTNTREAVERKLAGYWVRLPIEDTLPPARRIVRDLKDRKISDISVVPLDDGRYAISLGVFSMEHTAQRRYSQFVSMGYAPQIEDRYTTHTMIWIDVKDNEPSLLAPETWRDLTGKFAAIRRVGIACE